MMNDKELVMSDYIKRLEQENITLRIALCNLRNEYINIGGNPDQLELFDKIDASGCPSQLKIFEE